MPVYKIPVKWKTTGHFLVRAEHSDEALRAINGLKRYFSPIDAREVMVDSALELDGIISQVPDDSAEQYLRIFDVNDAKDFVGRYNHDVVNTAKKYHEFGELKGIVAVSFGECGWNFTMILEKGMATIQNWGTEKECISTHEMMNIT